MPLDIANFIGNPAQTYGSAGKTLTDITDTLDYTSTLAFKIDKYLSQLENEKQAKSIALKNLLDSEMINRFNAQYKVDAFNSNEAYRRDAFGERIREFNVNTGLKEKQLNMQEEYNKHMMDMNEKKYELAKQNQEFNQSRLAKIDEERKKYREQQLKLKEQELLARQNQKQKQELNEQQNKKIRQSYAHTMNMYQQKLVNAKTDEEKKKILNDMAMLNREYQANWGKQNLLYGVNNAIIGSKSSRGTKQTPTLDFSTPKATYQSTTQILSSKGGQSKVKSAIVNLRNSGHGNIADIMEKAYNDYRAVGKDYNNVADELINDTFNNIKDKDSAKNILNNQGYVGELFSDAPILKDMFNIKSVDKYKQKIKNIYKKDLKDRKILNGIPTSKYLIDNFFENPNNGFNRNIVAGAGFDKDMFKNAYKKVYGDNPPTNFNDFFKGKYSTSLSKKKLFEKIMNDKSYPFGQIAKESAKFLVSYRANGEDIKPATIKIKTKDGIKTITLSPDEIKGFANIYTVYKLTK